MLATPVRRPLAIASGQPPDVVSFAAILATNDSASTGADNAVFFVDADYTDAQAAPTEAVEAGFSGYQDAGAAPTEAKSSSLTRWSTSFTVSGTAPTNPGNALAENNGTQAICKAGGVPSVGSSLFLTIAAPLTGCGSAPTCLVYYQTLPAAAGDILVKYVDYRQLGLGSNTRVSLPAGNFSVTPYSVVLPNIDSTFPVLPAFGISSSVSATGGQINIDAVGISSTGIL
jgi:hypothetical protein